MGCPCQSCRSGKGLFSYADTETAACNLLRVGLVDIRHDLFEGGGIEALGENGSPSDDILTGSEFFGVTVQHFLFDGVSECFSFGLGFLNQFLKGSEGFDLGGESVVDIFVCSFL